MMKTSYAILSLIIASIIAASSAITVSASYNLLQNPGFETGGFSPWDWNGDEDDGDYDAWISSSTVHSGSWAVGMYVYGWEADVLIWQDIAPRCARYFEFWYLFDYAYVEYDASFHADISYTDGTRESEELAYVEEWTFVHIDLDTTKQVKYVELHLWVEEGDIETYADDFYLAACSSPVGGELMPTLTYQNPLMAIAVVVSIVASITALGYKFTKR